MQWNHEFNAGFTTADSAFRKVIAEGSYGYPRINVADQYRDPNSLLNWMSKIIRLRKSCPEIGLGDYTVLDAKSPHVLAIQYDYNGKSLLILHNFSKEPVQARLKTKQWKVLYNLMAETGDTIPSNGTLTVDLTGYGYQWYRADVLLP